MALHPLTEIKNIIIIINSTSIGIKNLKITFHIINLIQYTLPATMCITNTKTCLFKLL